MSKRNGNGALTLKLDPHNARKHPDRNKAQIAASLKELGAGRSILVDATDTIIAGNGVYEQAQALGYKVKVIEADGKTLIAVKRPDLKGAKARRMALADNRATETSEWDTDILADLAANDADALAGLFDERELRDLLGDKMPGGNGAGDNNYSRKIEAPIYTPKGEKPTTSKLFDDSKTKLLVADIDASGLPEDEKAFLRVAAQRHTVLNFKLIADYYAHSDKPTQKLMEDSALVIIDFNRAIELGYVKLSEQIAEQYKKDYPDA